MTPAWERSRYWGGQSSQALPFLTQITELLRSKPEQFAQCIRVNRSFTFKTMPTIAGAVALGICLLWSIGENSAA